MPLSRDRKSANTALVSTCQRMRQRNGSDINSVYRCSAIAVPRQQRQGIAIPATCNQIIDVHPGTTPQLRSDVAKVTYPLGAVVMPNAHGFTARQTVQTLSIGPEKAHIAQGGADVEDRGQRLLLVWLGRIKGADQPILAGGDQGVGSSTT